MTDHLRDLIPDPKNARRHNPRNIGLVRDSLQEVGAARSIVIDENNVILAGNGVVEAAAEAGIERVRVVEADGNELIAVRRRGLTPRQKARLGLFDNRTPELAEWETDVLAELNDDGLLDGLFRDDELAALLAAASEPSAGLTDPDAVPEPPAEPTTKPGDLWRLGRHRLLCADATDPLQVDRLLGGGKPAVVYTDPPYGINAVTGKRGQWGGVAERYRPVANDTSGDVAKDAYRLVAAMGVPVQIFWGANHYVSVLPDSPCWIVWYKRDGADANDFADCELAWTNQPSRARLVHHVWNGFLRDSEQGEARIHPTQKPVFLVEWCLQEYGKPGDLVLDLFLGSGSTLIACERIGRTCLGMEIDAGYVDAVVRRWEQFTGGTAELVRPEAAS